MQIRRLDTADAAAHRAFRLRGLREHPEAFTSSFEEAQARPLSDSEKRLAEDSGEKFWAAFVDGQIAGTVGLKRERRSKSRHKATLVALFVARDYAGQGIGQALVDTVLQDADASGIELIVLTVTDTNLGARQLYERAGFQSFGTEPDALRTGSVSHGKTHMFLKLGRV